MTPSSPLTEPAQSYLTALLNTDRAQATHLIMDAVARGVSIKTIYLDIFQAALYEIGRLWQTNHISVAQEHFCTAATQMIMAQLYPHIFNTKRVGRRMVATCVNGELHEIGIRMVADFFEMEGWDTYYVGANLPVQDIISTLEAQEVHLLCISATMQSSIVAAQEIIEAVRASDAGQPVKILVGGSAFLQHEDLWLKIGADGFGRTAADALSLATQLVN